MIQTSSEIQALAVDPADPEKLVLVYHSGSVKVASRKKQSQKFSVRRAGGLKYKVRSTRVIGKAAVRITDFPYEPRVLVMDIAGNIALMCCGPQPTRMKRIKSLFD